MLFSPDQNTTSENIINMVADFYKSSTLEYLFDWVQGETSDYPNLSLQPLGFLNWFSRHGVDVNCSLYRHNQALRYKIWDLGLASKSHYKGKIWAFGTKLGLFGTILGPFRDF